MNTHVDSLPKGRPGENIFDACMFPEMLMKVPVKSASLLHSLLNKSAMGGGYLADPATFVGLADWAYQLPGGGGRVSCGVARSYTRAC